MNSIFEILKKEIPGYKTSKSLSNYYANIDIWEAWWKGYDKNFHSYKVTNIKKKLSTVQRMSLGMAKTVSEDWANLLLNDKTYIHVESSNETTTMATQQFLSGDEHEQNGGVLGASKFWKNGNACIEKAMALGTCAFVLDLVNPKVTITGEETAGALSGDNVSIRYIKNPKYIIPVSWDDKGITEIALSSHKEIAGQSYVYIQLMLKDEDAYIIKNVYYKESDNTYIKVESPEGTVESYKLPCKPFFILTPNIENNVDDVPLGISRYANAIDQLKSCDMSFDNLCNDFRLGKKKVYIHEDAVAMNEENQIAIGETIEQSLYVSLGELKPGEVSMHGEYNPQIRVDENKQGIEFFLNLLSIKVGLGQGRYKFDTKSMTTATEVRAGNKDLTESVQKQRIMVQDVLTEMTRNILILAKEVCNIPVDSEARIIVKFDDTLFADQDAERTRDMQEVRDGIMHKWEYRMKWYGDSEEAAKEATQIDTLE